MNTNGNGAKPTPKGDSLIDIKVVKNPIGAVLPGAGMFEFALYDESGAQIQTATNDADGIVTFTDVAIGGLGLHNFTVAELSAPAGWTVDATIHRVQVNVFEDATGATVTVIAYPDDFEGVGLFVNTFEQNTCGIVEFDEVYFNSAGDYEYYIRELSPSSEGWVKDGDIYRVRFHVEADGYGNLIPTVTYPDGYPHFLNTHHSALASYTISACKLGVGLRLEKGRFTFVLLDSASREVGRATNAAANPIITARESEMKEVRRRLNFMNRGYDLANDLGGAFAIGKPKKPRRFKRVRRRGNDRQLVDINAIINDSNNCACDEIVLNRLKKYSEGMGEGDGR